MITKLKTTKEITKIKNHYDVEQQQRFFVSQTDVIGYFLRWRNPNQINSLW